MTAALPREPALPVARAEMASFVGVAAGNDSYEDGRSVGETWPVSYRVTPKRLIEPRPPGVVVRQFGSHGFGAPLMPIACLMRKSNTPAN